MTSRGWIFTIHDYTEEQLQKGRVFLETAECIGISAGLERCPTTDRKHIQGYVRLDDSYRKGKFQKIIGPNANGKANWFMKKANGDYASNAKYTSKDENVCWHKIPPEQHRGTRTDLMAFREALKRKATDEELFEDHLPILAKYPRLESRLKSYYSKQSTKEFRKLTNAVWWGPGGTGKSKRALYNSLGKRLDDTYIVPSTENLKWFLDYDGEKTIIINEMSGAKCKYDRWKELTDGHQMVVETKNGHVYAEWTSVIMTSNKDPNTWWCDKVEGSHTNYTEFKRRLGLITEIKE